MVEDEMQIAVQVSGKMAGKITVAADEDEASVLAKARIVNIVAK